MQHTIDPNIPSDCPLLTADYASWCPAEMQGVDLSTVDSADQCPLAAQCSETQLYLKHNKLPQDHSIFWRE